LQYNRKTLAEYSSAVVQSVNAGTSLAGAGGVLISGTLQVMPEHSVQVQDPIFA